MNFGFTKITMIAAALNASTYTFAEEPPQSNEVWRCEGFCYYGGDAPNSPFVPVVAHGATEEEARDNIDCNGFEEVNITCSIVSDDDSNVEFVY